MNEGEVVVDIGETKSDAEAGMSGVGNDNARYAPYQPAERPRLQSPLQADSELSQPPMLNPDIVLYRGFHVERSAVIMKPQYKKSKDARGRRVNSRETSPELHYRSTVVCTGVGTAR